jgi:hypothetical protein
LYDPGVILFRDRDGGNRLLLLFLIGETPTGGIHKVAFQNALWQIEELADWRGSKTEKAAQEVTKRELRIISPCFSGSDASLTTLLKEWVNGYVEPPEVRIVSGSVIAVDKGDFLGKIACDKVSFHTTVIERDRANDEFYKYLKGLDSWCDRSDDGPRVALLSEAGTAHPPRADSLRGGDCDRRAGPHLSRARDSQTLSERADLHPQQ